MSSTQEEASSQPQRRPKTDKGRRVWTPQEESILIASLKELLGLGWKSDNGFRAGYLSKLEESMKVHYPTTDLRATPHINSKLQMWKKNYNSLTTIMGNSGVGLNPVTHKIDCEDQAWESIIKADQNARGMRYKSWPYFDAWKEIFGKDRANGEAAEDLIDAYNDLRTTADGMDTEDMGVDDNVELEEMGDPETAAESNADIPRRPQTKMKPVKKFKATEAINGVCDILVEIGRKADQRLASLAESLGYEARLGKVLEDAFDELGSIPHLTDEERFEVCGILGTQADKLKIFKGMPQAKRPRYVAWLLTKFHA